MKPGPKIELICAPKLDKVILDYNERVLHVITIVLFFPFLFIFYFLFYSVLEGKKDAHVVREAYGGREFVNLLEVV